MEISGVIKKENTNFRVHPVKFTMWLFLGVSGMMFAAFTSAYIVRRAEGNWDLFSLPDAFLWSLGIILFSSVTLQTAYFAAKKDQISLLKGMLALTLVLGLTFVYSQYLGYLELVKNEVFLVGNPSGSFVYIITFMHLLHIIGAIGILMYVSIRAFNFRVHSKNMLSLDVLTVFWHFLGALWLYLFIFLTFNR